MCKIDLALMEGRVSLLHLCLCMCHLTKIRARDIKKINLRIMII